MGFGYYDSSWMYPEEEPYDVEDREIEIEFDKDIVNWEVDSELVFEKELEDYYDDDYNLFVMSKNELEEIIYVNLFPYLPKKSGRYYLSGWITVPYTVIVPFYRRNSRLPYDPERLEPVLQDIFPSQAVVGKIKFEPVI